VRNAVTSLYDRWRSNATHARRRRKLSDALDTIGPIDSKAFDDVRCAVMTDDRESLHAQPIHQSDRVRGEDATVGSPRRVVFPKGSRLKAAQV
jgi:hypothetical protein